MLLNSPNYPTCSFSWYGLLIMVGGVGCVGGDFSQTGTCVCVSQTQTDPTCTNAVHSCMHDCRICTCLEFLPSVLLGPVMQFAVETALYFPLFQS